jgi:hypothetical protein
MYCGVPSDSPVCVTRAPPALETASVCVRVVERVRCRRGDPHRFVDRQLLLARQAMSQTFALDEGHDVEEQSFRFARVEEGKKIRMLECRRDANLAQEPFSPEDGAELGIENL